MLCMCGLVAPADNVFTCRRESACVCKRMCECLRVLGALYGKF